MGEVGVDDLLRRGREALAAADWEEARAWFERAGELGETAEVLDGLSEVAHFQADYERAIDLKERAFSAYRRCGKAVQAADTARWLAFLHGTFRGNFAVASGWIARAETLLEPVDECAAHGWLILDRAPFTRDVSERERVAAAALAIGRRFGDADPSSTRWRCSARAMSPRAGWSRACGSSTRRWPRSPAAMSSPTARSARSAAGS